MNEDKDTKQTSNDDLENKNIDFDAMFDNEDIETWEDLFISMLPSTGVVK